MVFKWIPHFVCGFFEIPPRPWLVSADQWYELGTSDPKVSLEIYRDLNLQKKKLNFWTDHTCTYNSSPFSRPTKVYSWKENKGKNGVNVWGKKSHNFKMFVKLKTKIFFIFQL